MMWPFHKHQWERTGTAQGNYKLGNGEVTIMLFRCQSNPSHFKQIYLEGHWSSVTLSEFPKEKP